VTLATLAIHAEAWLQEELAAQRAVLAALGRLDGAARGGATRELETAASELERTLARAGEREVRRGALLARLAGELGLPASEVTLSKLAARLAAASVETKRLETLRAELRVAVAAVLKSGRRLAAVAKAHRGLFDEVCRSFLAQAPAGAEHLIDARA
jgi:hypothetical protein